MSYDAFLSHSHTDKDWTHRLHDRLATQDYFDRALRIWLDARVLDPGDLSSARELESALDRSRRVILVLSEASLKSTWVQHEIEYFLKSRTSADLLLIRLQPCDLPTHLKACRLIDWSQSADEKAALEQVLQFLKPAEDSSAEYSHRHKVRRTFGNARYDLPTDYDPAPTKAAHDMLRALTAFDIGNLDEEGLALIGFDSAGQFVAELDADESYATRMVLGEILAICMLRNPAWSAVARAYVNKDYGTESASSFLTLRNRALRGKTTRPSATNLLFAVAESASKLAAIAQGRVDLSTLAALLIRLDQHETLDKQQQSIARLVARTLGKLRGNPAVRVLIHALVKWGGQASHLAAAGAISSAFERLLDSEDFYTDELAQYAGKAETHSVEPPTPDIARLLFEPYSGLGLDIDLMNEMKNCRAEFKRNFGAYADGPWPPPRFAPPVVELVNGPIVGTVRKITLDNMETLADRLGSGDIACLTEPRIVDALFDNAGAFLIDESEMNASLGERLRRRKVRFAGIQSERLQGLEEGLALVLWPPLAGHSIAGLQD